MQAMTKREFKQLHAAGEMVLVGNIHDTAEGVAATIGEVVSRLGGVDKLPYKHLSRHSVDSKDARVYVDDFGLIHVVEPVSGKEWHTLYRRSVK